MRTRQILLCLILGGLGACGKSGDAMTRDPEPSGAALPPKEEGEQLARIRAALDYRRAAEQRGKLVWRNGEAGGRAALEGMYLQGTQDLGELSLVRSSAKQIDASISIVARGSGVGTRCNVTLSAGDEALSIRSQLRRNAAPPEGLRVEVDRLEFDLGLDQLQRLASTPDSAGTACGLPFSFTRAQRDRLDRIATMFASAPDEAAVDGMQAAWDDDRPPGEGGGFASPDPGADSVDADSGPSD